MNLLKLLLGCLLLFIFFTLSTTPFSACTKTKTEIEHDTTVVTRTDTLTRVDTVVKIDTTYDLHYGLVAYYNFNNGSLNDSSGYGNNITFNNNATPTSDRKGNSNGAYLFNGTSSYMTVPNSPSLNPSNMTLMATFKVNGFYTDLCHANQILGKGYNDYINGFYMMRFSDFAPDCSTPANLNNEMFSAGPGNAAGLVTDTCFVKMDQWYNLIYTYDGTVAKIYLDGQLKKAINTAALNFDPNTHDLFVGKHEDPQYPYYFNGVIDEIRIYNRALPLGAVQQLSK